MVAIQVLKDEVENSNRTYEILQSDNFRAMTRKMFETFIPSEHVEIIMEFLEGRDDLGVAMGLMTISAVGAEPRIMEEEFKATQHIVPTLSNIPTLTESKYGLNHSGTITVDQALNITTEERKVIRQMLLGTIGLSNIEILATIVNAVAPIKVKILVFMATFPVGRIRCLRCPIMGRCA